MPDLLSVVLRALGFVALAQAGGAALFLVVFGSRISASRDLILRLVRIAAIWGLVLLPTQYLLEAARMTGELGGAMDLDMQRLALHAPAAPVVAVRLSALLLLLWSVRGNTVAPRFLGALAAALVALSFTLIGHVHGSAARWLLMPLLGLHLLVIEFWFGSLLPLRLVGAREAPAQAMAVVELFSKIAMWLVPLIFAAGMGMAFGLLPDAAALHRPYGRGVLLKALVFTLLMVPAALNKWRLGPALVDGGRGALRRFQHSITLEFALIALMLAGTAVLTSFWSPES